MEIPKEFPFPFPPYPIQADFMKNLYRCLENGNLGIFESPTGTGKTLSVICGAVKWLLDHEEKQKSTLTEKKAELDSKIKEMEAKNVNDWFSVQTEQIGLNSEKQTIQKKLDGLSRIDEKRLKYKERVREYHEESKKKEKQFFNNKWKNSKSNAKKESQDTNNENEIKDEFIDDDLLLKDTDCRSDSSDEEEAVEETSRICKIFFCSRTHSQLSQFVGELQKSPYSDKVSLVPLASR